ncbi:Protein of unknown function DUF1376 [uncultured Caudovirales phage]|uniref:DUF1376 domain-containing protein n=1 Tax=uncultured Caudovirales phage TaxID=2100421 RepID=A0A6J5MQT0_9CAUD|nr:Protein of unknown function DUF1376 [uncultured Caudovirales phage]
MSKSSPAFQFYAQDFLVGTQDMSAAARGCFVSMLASSWVKGPITDTPRALAAAMCLTPFDPPFEALWQEIAPKWTLIDGAWTNRRLEAVRAEQDAYRERQSEKGIKSAAARKATGRQPDTQPEVNHGSTTVQPALQPEGQPEVNPSPLTFAFDLRSSSLPSSSTSEVQTLSRKNRAGTDDPTDFAEFWAVYPRKTGKGAAKRAWTRQKPPLQKCLDAIAWQVLTPDWCRDQGQYIPHPSTWLNNRRWEDEPFHPPMDLTPRRGDTMGVAGMKALAHARLSRGESLTDAPVELTPERMLQSAFFTGTDRR